MVYKRVLVAGVLLLLGGCVREVEIDVRQHAGQVTFTVTRDGKPACIDRIAVYEGAVETHASMWSIMAGPEQRCASDFTLGQSPAGFSASDSVAPERLRHGATFTVSVGGPGFMGSKTFAID